MKYGYLIVASRLFGAALPTWAAKRPAIVLSPITDSEFGRRSSAELPIEHAFDVEHDAYMSLGAVLLQSLGHM